MGFPLQAGAPQIVIGGVTFAIGAALDTSKAVVGAVFSISIYKLDPDHGWMAGAPELEYGAGALLADVQAKGGIVKYCDWIVARLNAQFDELFAASASSPAINEPGDDAEAIAAIAAHINALKLSMVNGVPVLS